MQRTMQQSSKHNDHANARIKLKTTINAKPAVMQVQQSLKHNDQRKRKYQRKPSDHASATINANATPMQQSSKHNDHAKASFKAKTIINANPVIMQAWR